MSIPDGYDPITMNHWLWYMYKCHTCSAGDFQTLFENILKRSDPDFISIRPYGKTGDRKCDGLFFVDGSSTVYQVYSPDELKQAEVIAKINEDFDGAKQHWAESLKRWVFVYNARRGLAPDIPRILAEKQRESPTIEIDHLSHDKLWEMTRNLSLQQRSEILGAPTGYENLFFSESTDSNEIRERLATDSFVLVQDIIAPIDLQSVSDALKPARPFGAPVFIRPALGDLPWTAAAREQQAKINEVIMRSRFLAPRFSVFSYAWIPLAIHLGFLLSDRVAVRYFQFDRENRSWTWRPAETAVIDEEIRASGLPADGTDEPVEIAIAVSLSAAISEADIREAAPATSFIANISVSEPDVMWLQGESQILKLGKIFRGVLAGIRSKAPRCSKIHLFYAGPTGGAVIIGQQINPRMNPPVDLYQFSQQTAPRNQYALTLTEELS